jgi:hypothetical protein
MPASSLIFVGVGFLTMMTGVLVGNLSMGSMLERVNRDRTSGTEISPYWWHAAKTWKVINLYRAIEPNGKLLTRALVAGVLLLTGFAAAASGLLFSAAHSQVR